MKDYDINDIWNEMSLAISHQKKLDNQIIMEMTKEKYHQKINNISQKEKIGAVICYIIVAFIIYSIQDQDTWYLLTCSIISLIFYAVLPVLSLKSISDMDRINFSTLNLKDTLTEFGEKKRKFLMVQQLGIYTGFLILFVLLPPVTKTLNGKDVFMDTSNWKWYIPISLLLLGTIARWGYGYYKRTLESAEAILSDF